MRILVSLFPALFMFQGLFAQRYVIPLQAVPGSSNPAFRFDQDTAQVLLTMNYFQNNRNGKLTNFVQNAHIQEEFRNTTMHLNFIHRKYSTHYGAEAGEVFRHLRFSTDESDKQYYQTYNTGYLKYYINTSPFRNITVGISAACISGYHRGYALDYYDWVYSRPRNNQMLYAKFHSGIVWNVGKFAIGTSMHIFNEETHSPEFAVLASYKHQWRNNTLFIINEFKVGYANYFNVSLSLDRHTFITYQYHRMKHGEGYFTDLNSLSLSLMGRRSALQSGFIAYLKHDSAPMLWFSPFFRYNLSYRCDSCREQRQSKRLMRQQQRKDRVRYDTIYY